MPADVVSPAVRSRMMAGIKGKNTKPELLLRSELHRRGFRFRLHRRDLPGRPDLVFPKRGAAIFVNGCFWHGHDCHLFRWPGTRPEFWRDKIGANIERDLRNRDELLAEGWRVAEIWECTLKGRERLSPGEVLATVDAFIDSDTKFVSVGGYARVTYP